MEATSPDVLAALISKLDSSSIILLIMCYGVWKLAGKWLVVFNRHGEKLTESVGKIQEDINEMKVNIAVVATSVSQHEERITRLERGDK